MEFSYAEDNLLSMLLEFKRLVFEACGGSQQYNRPQNRVFREKLALDTLSGHKQHQTRLHGLDIGGW